jgi:SAM-dependent methyltransferase
MDATPLHLDRRRAGSFGVDAERYDRARPSYPQELIEELLSDSARSVLDVGCGTGIVGSLFQARGCDVLGVEPDARMARVARSRGLTVEIAPFERWTTTGALICLSAARRGIGSTHRTGRRRPPPSSPPAAGSDCSGTTDASRLRSAER